MCLCGCEHELQHQSDNVGSGINPFAIILGVLFLIIIIIIISGCASGNLKWSPTDKALLGASWIAAGADYATTINMLDNPNNYEMNPIMGEHPSSSTVLTYMLSSQIITTVIAHYFPRYRKVLLGSKTVVNGGLAINNSRLENSGE